MSDETASARSFHGRRKGKALRTAQADRIARLLPGLRIALPRSGAIDLRSLFPRAIDRTVLEIGFGGGEHLAARASEYPDTGFIGVEPFVNGMAKLFGRIEAERLDNIRIYDDDAKLLLSALPDGSVDLVYLLFPDPWPKRRQRKRRFLDDRNLQALGRVLRPGGELRFATDIDDYAGWALVRVARSPDFAWRPAGPSDWRRPWPGWPGTRYEAKAAAAGRASSYLTFSRVPVSSATTAC